MCEADCTVWEVLFNIYYFIVVGVSCTAVFLFVHQVISLPKGLRDPFWYEDK
jgi:hypothetical protein